MKPEYPEKTADMPQITDKPDIVSCWYSRVVFAGVFSTKHISFTLWDAQRPYVSCNSFNTNKAQI